MMNEFSLTRLDDISITRLDNIPITILDEIQTLDPNALVNRVFMMQSIEKNISIPELISEKYQ